METPLSSYSRYLEQYVWKSIVNMGVQKFLPEENFEEAISLITGQVFTLADANRYKGATESFATNRDKTLLCVLLGKEKIYAGKVENFFYEDIELFAVIEELIANAKKSKKIFDEYFKATVKRGCTTITCDRFCANARLLLAFKHLQLSRNAENKQYSLLWMGSRSVPPTVFNVEDYWYYEQKTGVNLSVEIAASVDELFSNHKDVLIFDDINTKNFIIDTLCKCIEDNYGYIAPIPMIDWKIAAMKAACTYIVQSFIDVFLEKKDINDTYIGAVLTGIKKSHDSESLTTQSEIEAFLNGVMELRLSIIFNQLLCIFVVDSLGDHHIVDGAAKLSDISRWMNVRTAHVQFPQKIFSVQSELQNYTRFVSNYKGNADAEKKYLKERIDDYEKRARLLFTRIENGKDLYGYPFCSAG